MPDNASTVPNSIFRNRYQLLRRVARGGMADVYLAQDMTLDRHVALKVLFPEFASNASFVERFRREAKAAANLNHPNIVRIYDWGQEQGTYYIVMEYVEGRSIADVLRSTGPLQPNRAAKIAADMASALANAHDAGLVHRDVKLSNVMVSDDGEVKVTDFGIATALIDRDSGETLTQIGSVTGTATYFSPEQAQGKPLDGRSDLYSLGVVLYEMIVGEPPFSADTPTAVAVKHVQDRPVPPSQMGVNIAESLEAIILKLLAKNPTHRYPKAADLQADLKRYLDGAHNLPATTALTDGRQTTDATAHSATAAHTLPTSPQDPPPTPQTPPSTPQTTQSSGGHTSHPETPAPQQTDPHSSTNDSHIQHSQHPAPTSPAQTPVKQPPGESGPPATAHGPALSHPGHSGPATYYYEEVSPHEGWKHTAWMLMGLAILAAVLAYLGVRFYQELGFDDSGSGGAVPEDMLMVDMPDLTGLGILEAEARARRLGLGVDMTYRINKSVTENTVFAQDPLPGERTRVGEIVLLTVSRDETQRVPPVRGRNSIDAKTILEDKGYIVIQEKETDQAETGTVIGQDPPSGSELDPGHAVTITVSTGPGQIFVPDVRRKIKLEAVRQLTSLGFRVAEREEASESFEAGTVIDTDPTVGTPLDPQSEVFVLVSSGPPIVQVPDVRGMLFDTGRLNIERAGLKLGSTIWKAVEAGSPNIGRILDQTPLPEEEVRQGTPIDVTVGGGAIQQEPDDTDLDGENTENDDESAEDGDENTENRETPDIDNAQP